MRNKVIKIPTLDRLYIFKSDLFNRLPVKRLTGLFLSWGITPNILTMLGFLISGISIVFLFVNTKYFAIFYLIGRFIDIWDGYMAREFNMITDKGDRLDHLGDMGIHGSLLLKSVFYFGFPWISLLALTIFVGEYLLLKKDGLLKKKFPSGMFTYFFMFDLYLYGLVIQIFYQVFSYLAFVMNIKKKQE